MYKKMLLITSILIMGGCAGKKDFTQGVSEEDKKLLSSYDDKVLYTHPTNGIRVTQNGFYPDCNIKSEGIVKPPGIEIVLDESQCYYTNRYMSEVASFSPIKKFNFKKFMDVIYKDKLKNIKVKIFAFKKKYPSVNVSLFTPKEIDTLLSKSVSLYEKQKILLAKEPRYIAKITNPSESLKIIAIKSNPLIIRMIKNPTEKLQELALEGSIFAVENIPNPTKRILSLAISKCNHSSSYLWDYADNRCARATPLQAPTGYERSYVYKRDLHGYRVLTIETKYNR